MNQIVLHNYSAWSMAAVLHEMSKSLTDKLEQSPPAGVERSPIIQNHGNFCKGKSVTTVAMRPELFVSISFLAKDEESLFTHDEEEEHLRIRYPGPYDPRSFLVWWRQCSPSMLRCFLMHLKALTPGNSH